MVAIGQTINILSVTVFLAAALLAALGKLSARLFFTTGVATNIVGLIGTSISGSVWGATLHVIAIGCFIAALAVHRLRSS
jgi:phosphotransferase system  glucose/maltose/N-acetylglucosamine-specific IIC component